MPFSITSWPILAHALLALPPSLKFLLNPPPSGPDIAPLIRSYGFLLLSTHVITLTVALSTTPSTHVLARIALGCSLYHAGPIQRAWSRLRQGEPAFTTDLGGPAVHLILHAILGAVLLAQGRSANLI